MMFTHARIAMLFALASITAAGSASAQSQPSPLAGAMVSAGLSTLVGEGGATFFPTVHGSINSRAGWGADLGIGASFSDGTSVLIDLGADHVFASQGSSVGASVMLGPTAIFEGGESVFGVSGGVAFLARIGKGVGIRLDATPRIYFFDGESAFAAVFTVSITSLPKGWHGK